MKKQNTQFEKNITRLVKSTGQSQIPSENFTNNLIDEALKELHKDQPGRQKRSTPMKIVKIIAAVAASLLLVSGVFFIATPRLSKIKMMKQPLQEVSMASKVYSEGSDLYVDAVISSPSALYFAAPSESPNMAHGGTTPPNGQPVDAMFFKTYGVNPFIDTEDDRFSTFAIDVDTGSYTVCRSYLQDGHLPPKEAVRVEEFVNYFDYGYPAPRENPFSIYFEAMPWQFGQDRKNTHLMRIGLKAMEIPDQYRKPAILTFVIDVSGSMDMENRLGLVKQSLRLLVDKLRPDDKIGIAVYGDEGRKILDPTSLSNKARILRAINSLKPDGSTNAEEGITIGYQMAQEAFVPGYINRVILCSDGVANVGATGPDQIFKIIKDKADKGITLSALGFGMGNYNDVLMEQLGNKGNGYYAYIDTLDEAKRLFSNLTGALQVVARDVKIQVDFNPDVVRSYRLIGYENRDVADIDFRNDIVDGGEIGAGHAATALYELKLWPEKSGKIATTYVRYKDADTFEVAEFHTDFETAEIQSGFDSVSPSFALATVATEFAEILRESYWAKGADLQSTLEKANELVTLFQGDSDVAELVSLIQKASSLDNEDRAKLQESEINY